MHTDTLAAIKAHFTTELDHENIIGIILLGAIGTGKTRLIEELTGKCNCFTGNPFTTSEFTETDTQFIAIDETEYASEESIKNCILQAHNDSKIILFSAQTDKVINEKIKPIWYQVKLNSELNTEEKSMLVLDITRVRFSDGSNLIELNKV